MGEPVRVTGMVLKAESAGEYDRKMVILTADRGKITVYAQGARRPNNRFMAASNPFVFADFTIYEKRNSYGLSDVDVKQYFEMLRDDFDHLVYGSYFLELADYYTRENLEATELLNLLYFALKALLKDEIPDALVRYIFEIRALVIDGQYPGLPTGQWSQALQYTMDFIVSTPINKLFSFTLKDTVLVEMEKICDHLRRRFLDRPMKSLELLP